MNDIAELYWECHVTVKPPLEESEWKQLERISKDVGFQIATFQMIKESKQPEAFTSARDKSYANITRRMCILVVTLTDWGFNIVRYKIEGTMLDSKFQGDCLNLVPNSGKSHFVKGTLNF